MLGLILATGMTICGVVDGFSMRMSTTNIANVAIMIKILPVRISIIPGHPAGCQCLSAVLFGELRSLRRNG
jgi:hypothetical protein